MITQGQNKIYVYSIRRAIIDKRPQFVEMIPKLYSSLYEKNIDVKKFVDNIISIDNDKLKVFTKLLSNYNNEQSLLENSEYLKNDEKIIIKQLNLKWFD